MARTTTSESGGYALEVPDGSYLVTAVGDGVRASQRISVDSAHVKVDFEAGVVPGTDAPVITELRIIPGRAGETTLVEILVEDIDT